MPWWNERAVGPDGRQARWPYFPVWCAAVVLLGLCMGLLYLGVSGYFAQTPKAVSYPPSVVPSTQNPPMAAISVAPSPTASATQAPTAAPTSTVAAPTALPQATVAATLTVVPTSVSSAMSPSASSVGSPGTSNATVTARAGTGTGSLTTEQIVEAAYRRYLDITAQAAASLDTSHLTEVAAGDTLIAFRNFVETLRAKGQAVQTDEQHSLVLHDLGAKDGWGVEDKYLNRSILVDAKTRQPLETPDNKQLEVFAQMKFLDGTWKVTHINQITR